MTIDQIFEIISPYVSVGGVVALVSAVIAIAAKVYGVVKRASASVAQTAMLNEDKIVELMKSVLPKDMAVKIMPLVESELKKINEAVQEAAAENVKKTTAKLDAIATAVASMRNLPTEQREKLLALIEEENKDDAQTVTLAYEVSDDIKAIAEAGEQEEKTAAFEPVID